MEANVDKPLRILVVEDDSLVRGFIANHFRDEGHFVLEARNGEEALAILDDAEEEFIDVLFTDIQLGGRTDGWEVAEAFRNRKPQIPVIYASGRGHNPKRSVPGSVFFDKPYLPGEILEACGRLVD